MHFLSLDRLLYRLALSNDCLVIYAQSNSTATLTYRRFSRLSQDLANFNVDARQASDLLVRVDRLRNVSFVHFFFRVDLRDARRATYLNGTVYLTRKDRARKVKLHLLRLGVRSNGRKDRLLRDRGRVRHFIALHLFALNCTQASGSRLYVQVLLLNGTYNVMRQQANTQRMKLRNEGVLIRRFCVEQTTKDHRGLLSLFRLLGRFIHLITSNVRHALHRLSSVHGTRLFRYTVRLFGDHLRLPRGKQDRSDRRLLALASSIRRIRRLQGLRSDSG